MLGGPVSARGSGLPSTGPPRPSGSMTQLAAAVRAPTGPALTIVLVCHVAVALVALVAVVAGAVAAVRVLTANGELAPSVRSYFAPGVNWTGRALYLVPAFGAALLAMSGGAYRPGAPWVEWGTGLWVAAAALAEGVLWPAERRVQRSLAGVRGPGVPRAAIAACRTMCVSAAGVVVLVAAAMAVMTAKP